MRELRMARSPILPYLLVVGGVVLDYATTSIGLELGFRETRPFFNPLLQVAVVLGILGMLDAFMKKWPQQVWRPKLIIGLKYFMVLIVYVAPTWNLTFILPVILGASIP